MNEMYCGVSDRAMYKPDATTASLDAFARVNPQGQSAWRFGQACTHRVAEVEVLEPHEVPDAGDLYVCVSECKSQHVTAATSVREGEGGKDITTHTAQTLLLPFRTT